MEYETTFLVNNLVRFDILTINAVIYVYLRKMIEFCMSSIILVFLRTLVLLVDAN